MHKIFLFLVLVGLMLGCAPQIQTSNPTVKLPAAYGKTVSDTALVALPSWKSVYFDSTLSNLIEEALLKNFDVQTAAKRIESYRSQVVLTKGIQLPNLGLQVGAGVRRFGDYTVDGVGNYDTQFSPNLNSKQALPNPIPDYYVGFQSSWEADIWGKLKNKKKSALYNYLASQMGKNLVITSTIAEVANAYFHLLALDSERRIYQENIGIQQNSLEAVRINRQIGRDNQLAVEIMEAQLLDSREKEIEVEQQVIIAENDLNFLLGRIPQPVARPQNLLVQSLPALVQTGVPSALLQHRADIREAELQLRANHADVQAARFAFYPSLNLNANLGLQAFNAALLFEAPASVAFSLLGGLTAPLLNRRELKSQLLASETNQQLAVIHYEKTVVRSFTEVYQTMLQLTNTQRMLTIKEQQVAVLANAISTSTELFRTGRSTYLEVNNAQRNHLQAQLELVNVKKRQFFTLTELYRSLGGGWQ